MCYLVKELKAMTEKSSVSIRFREQAAVGVLCGGYAKEHSRAANQKADCHTGPSPLFGDEALRRQRPVGEPESHVNGIAFHGNAKKGPHKDVRQVRWHRG